MSFRKFGKKKKSRPQLNGDMELQITSMADIFTILLVFLLKSYATSAANVTPTAGMVIPEAHAGDTPVEALKVEISEKAVSVESQPIVNLEKFAFDPADMSQNGASKLLSTALEKERQRQLLIAKANSDVKVDPKIIIVADQRVPYSTIKTVLASAAVQGYTDFKLAVIKGD